VVSQRHTHRIVVDAAPVTVTANPPLVVSADNATVHAVAPELIATVFSTGVPTKTVEAALAPRVIVASKLQEAVLAAPVTLAITDPRT
jgi:hypothetical protein